MPPEKLDPCDDDRGTADHYKDGLQGLLLAEPRNPLDQELDIGFDRTQIDVLRVTSWHQRVMIVWHEINRARSWLMKS
jgi:hypothetical protein